MFSSIDISLKKINNIMKKLSLLLIKSLLSIAIYSQVSIGLGFEIVKQDMYTNSTQLGQVYEIDSDYFSASLSQNYINVSGYNFNAFKHAKIDSCMNYIKLNFGYNVELKNNKHLSIAPDVSIMMTSGHTLSDNVNTERFYIGAGIKARYTYEKVYIRAGISTLAKLSCTIGVILK